MTTLQHLGQTLTDIDQELARDQRFGQDAQAGLLKGVSLLRDAIDALERDIKTFYGERDQAISRVRGNNMSSVTMVEPGYQIGTEHSYADGDQHAYKGVDFRAKLVG